MNRFKFLVVGIFIQLSGVFAQDQVYMRNAPDFPIYINILEIGLNQIKYKSDYNDSSSTVFVVDNSAVYKVVLRNGQYFIFNRTTSLEEQTKQPKLAVIKTDFMSHLFGTTSVSFEKLVQPNSSLEIGLGLIGHGFIESSENGFYLKGGYKFYQKKNENNDSKHPLEGFYFKPEFVFNLYTQSFEKREVINATELNWPEYLITYRDTKAKNEYLTYGLMAVIGKSTVVQNLLTFDIYFGAGLGFSAKNKINGKEEILEQIVSRYSYSSDFNRLIGNESKMMYGSGFLNSADNGMSILFQLGIKVGLLIN